MTLQEQIVKKARNYAIETVTKCENVTKDELIEFAETDYIKGANAILEAMRWRDVKEELPSYKDGLVIVKVRNKNKENGIILYDICYIDEESNAWGKRYHTWEDILAWRPINLEDIEL